MSGSGPSAIQNIQQVSVSNGKNPNNGQVFGVPLTLVGTAVTLDLKTLVNLHRVNDVQGIFMDNSGGSTALQVSTTTGQKIAIPSGYQGVMPLYLSADKTITFNGNGTVNLVLLNFPTPAAVWPASGGGSADVVDGQLLVSDGTAQGLLSEIVSNTSGGGGGATGPFLGYGNDNASIKDVVGWVNAIQYNNSSGPTTLAQTNGSYPIMVVNSLKAVVSDDCYVTGGPYLWTAQFLFHDGNNNQDYTIISRNFIMPSALPTVRNMDGGIVLQWDDMNLRCPYTDGNVSLRMNWNNISGGSSLSNGELECVATYALITA